MTTPFGGLPWTEGRVDVDGVGLHYYRAGSLDRPPLVLVHGLSDNGRCWKRVTNALSDQFDIVMIDARNHGQSNTAQTSPSLLADDVSQVITQLNLGQAVVIGHSVGAHTAALMAGRHPGLVSRLVLEDPPWTATQESTSLAEDAAALRRQEILAWLGALTTMTDADLAALRRDQHPEWSDEDVPAWIESNQQVRVEAVDGLDFASWAPVAAAITCPTLLLYGVEERGGLVGAPVANRIAAQNSRITATLIDHAGHNIRRENFEQFIAVVGDFVVDESTTTLKTDSF